MGRTSRGNLTNRLRNLLGLADPKRDRASDGAGSTIVSDEIADDGGYRLPDALLERYQVKGVLGRGAFGIVYLAKDVRIGRLIAIKQLYRRHSSNRAILSRFIQEARIAGQLEHANIVTIFDVTGDSGSPCIVMEYLGGGNLATVLRQEGTLQPYRALIWMRAVMAGLEAAHHLRVIHRDVKPANILFDRQGTPKLGDFGVAHLPLDAGGLVAESTDSPAGTPDYMAPEQADQDMPVDGRADLFSAGALLLRMLTGARLYDFTNCSNFEHLADVILSTTVQQRAAGLLHQFPTEVQDLILNLLARHPNDRTPTAAAAIREIDRALTVIQPPDSWQSGRNYEPASSTAMFGDLLRLFLVDGIVSAPERHELNLRASRLGVPADKARELEEKIRREMDLPLLRDLELLTDEMSSWLAAGAPESGHRALTSLAESFNVSSAEQTIIEHDLRSHLALDDESAATTDPKSP